QTGRRRLTRDRSAVAVGRRRECDEGLGDATGRPPLLLDFGDSGACISRDERQMSLSDNSQRACKNAVDAGSIFAVCARTVEKNLTASFEVLHPIAIRKPDYLIPMPRCGKNEGDYKMFRLKFPSYATMTFTAMLLFAGCVSQQKYDALEAEY